MEEISYPAKFTSQHKAWAEIDRSNSYVDFIFDKNMFLSICNELTFFYQCNLINQKELDLLRAELLDLIYHLRLLAKTGEALTNAKASIYLSSIDIISCLAYFETDETACSQVLVYGLDVLQSYDADACLAQKEWLEQQKYYATRITKCNEDIAEDFFNKQVDYVNRMGVIQEM